MISCCIWLWYYLYFLPCSSCISTHFTMHILFPLVYFRCMLWEENSSISCFVRNPHLLLALTSFICVCHPAFELNVNFHVCSVFFEARCKFPVVWAIKVCRYLIPDREGELTRNGWGKQICVCLLIKSNTSSRFFSRTDLRGLSIFVITIAYGLAKSSIILSPSLSTSHNPISLSTSKNDLHSTFLVFR